jgi:cytochrome c peroxidase
MKIRLLVLGAALAAVGCDRGAAVTELGERGSATKTAGAKSAAASEADEINPRLLRRFQPVAGASAVDAPNPERVALGRALFYEKRLSENGQIACSTCHALSKYGVDGMATSIGVGGHHGKRNAPSVFNAATHIAQFWDGRAPNVEEQASGPLLSPLEMAMPGAEAVVAVLGAIPGYAAMFERSFPGDKPALSLKNVGDAIGAFERGLVTTSRWDKFIAGDASALTTTEKHGLRVFLDVGCVLCHTGPQVGGSMFQKVGAVIPWPNQKDLGRTTITKLPADRMVFKVPSLKNIVETAPYFHDGSSADLREAIRLMGHHQLGIELDKSEVEAIAAWMRSMTGEIDPAYIAAPSLPGMGTSL